ncbi:hypothetical protein M011DRAFT_187479 [Sporormia fimetaria CBS 119925]|uniref:Uncharacterized protein n=1 Tax=Sporormia fimetaria CBS 119925 TaxID=1340428 RepID=A0A6A6VL91_9PLEO|nr:hypothetical protein M011DRAFT_187479 [Sporormia fimetaria CBS 119925]
MGPKVTSCWALAEGIHSLRGGFCTLIAHVFHDRNIDSNLYLYLLVLHLSTLCDSNGALSRQKTNLNTFPAQLHSGYELHDTLPRPATHIWTCSSAVRLPYIRP